MKASPKQIIALCFILLTICADGQNKENQNITYESFDFYYVDNSLTSNNSIIKDTTIEIIQSKIANIGSESKFLFFISDGESYKTCEKTNLVNDSFLNELQQNYGERPKDIPDKKRIRKILYAKNFSVESKINMSFFVSKATATTVIEKWNSVVKSLPKELIFVFGGDHCQVSATIYYSDPSGDLTNDKLLSALKFNNNDKLDKRIAYHVIKL